MDDVTNLAAQITYKVHIDEQRNGLIAAYEAMSDEDLEHLETI